MKLFSFVSFAFVLFSFPTAKADLISDVWGIATDPFKLQSSTENVLQTVHEARNMIIALQSLQDNVDGDIRFYLSDLDKKIGRVEGASIAVIEAVSENVLMIEAQVMSDVRNLIRNTECAAIRVVDDAINDSLRGVLPSFLEGNSRRIKLPFGEKRKYFIGIIPIGYQENFFEIDLQIQRSPFETFKLIESAYIENINSAGEEDEVSLIIAAYGNLARLAKKTVCLYEGDEFSKPIMRKYAEYNAKIYPWNYTINYRI